MEQTFFRINSKLVLIEKVLIGHKEKGMKLLKQYQSLQQAQQESSRLEGLGMLAYVSSENSHHLGVNVTGAFNVGLWAVLENQHDDALKCLDDPLHLPSSALSPQELIAVKNQGGEQAMNKLYKISTLVFCSIGAVVTLAVGYSLWTA